MNTAYALIQSGFADWEDASAMAELRRTFGFSVKTIALSTETLVSMGDLRIKPDLNLSAFVPQSADVLMMPGGESWTHGELPEVPKATRAMVELGTPGRCDPGCDSCFGSLRFARRPSA